MTRRKRKERKEIAIYLNNRPIPQVERLIIFRYNIWQETYI